MEGHKDDEGPRTSLLWEKTERPESVQTGEGKSEKSSNQCLYISIGWMSNRMGSGSSQWWPVTEQGIMGTS